MKTETQIAEENVKELKSLESGDFDGQTPLKRMADFLELKKQSLTHKATCQRWLEFLDNIYCVIPPQEKCPECIEIMPIIDKKIIDLKQAIKLYEDAGI